MLGSAAIEDSSIEITVWINGREYPKKKTLKEMLIQAAKKT
jgi:hypothetical protein